MRFLSLRCLYLFSSRSTSSAAIATAFHVRSFGWFSAAGNPRMDKRTEPSVNGGSVKFKPEVGRLQQIVNANSSDGWERSWEQGVTPWDLGKPTPILLHLHRTGDLPKGRALIPGCGSGYDVVAIASPERHVTGLDISDKAIEKAKELSSSAENANYFTFIKADFFSWSPPQLFNLIFDYTLMIMLVAHHIKYRSQIMKRYYVLLALRLYHLLIMSWLFLLEREERSWQDGRGGLCPNLHCELPFELFNHISSQLPFELFNHISSLQLRGVVYLYLGQTPFIVPVV